MELIGWIIVLGVVVFIIYTQKPEVETVERAHTVGGKETTTMVETKEFKAWNKKYKRYIDIGKK